MRTSREGFPQEELINVDLLPVETPTRDDAKPVLLVGVPSIWDTVKGNPNVVVQVLDTGLDLLDGRDAGGRRVGDLRVEERRAALDDEVVPRPVAGSVPDVRRADRPGPLPRPEQDPVRDGSRGDDARRQEDRVRVLRGQHVLAEGFIRQVPRG